jgi:hypothetical protein
VRRRARVYRIICGEGREWKTTYHVEKGCTKETLNLARPYGGIRRLDQGDLQQDIADEGGGAGVRASIEARKSTALEG